MKKEENLPRKFESLSDFHRVFGLPKPLHPLISFIDLKDTNILRNEISNTFMLDFYKIAYKTNLSGRVKYGQNYYDFGEGGLVLTALTKFLKHLMVLLNAAIYCSSTRIIYLHIPWQRK